MPHIEAGQEIGVRCELASGPFSDEFLVTIETVTGPLSGFVPEKKVVQRTGEENYVLAIVKNVDTHTMDVWISGSFFTTTGLAQIPIDIATRL